MITAVYRCLLMVICVVAWSQGQAVAQTPTSETHDGLRRLLQRYPQADLNGDGILTMDEARRFRMRLWQEETDIGAPVEREQLETPVAPRYGDPYFMKTPYGSLPGQVFDLWLPRTAPPPRPTVFYLTGEDQAPAPSFLENVINAGMAVCVIYGRDHGNGASYFEDVATALDYLIKRNAAYGINLADLGIVATESRAEHALYAAFSPSWGDQAVPGVIRCAAILDAPPAESADGAEISYLERHYPYFYAALEEAPNLPAVALLNPQQHGGDLLHQALQHLGAETTLQNALSTEHETHLLRMAVLFFETHLAPKERDATAE